MAVNPWSYSDRGLAEAAGALISGVETLKEAEERVLEHFGPNSLIDIKIEGKKFVVGVRWDMDGYAYRFHCKFGPLATDVPQTT